MHLDLKSTTFQVMWKKKFSLFCKSDFKLCRYVAKLVVVNAILGISYPLTPRNDQHLISLPMVSIQYPANKYENTQTYRVEVVILI